MLSYFGLVVLGFWFGVIWFCWLAELLRWYLVGVLLVCLCWLCFGIWLWRVNSVAFI